MNIKDRWHLESWTSLKDDGVWIKDDEQNYIAGFSKEYRKTAEHIVEIHNQWLYEESKKDDWLIFGSEIDFEMRVKSNQVVKTCTEIWEYPSEFNDKITNNGEEAYYEFTKFLWIRSPKGKEYLLADIAEKDWLCYDCSVELEKEINYNEKKIAWDGLRHRGVCNSCERTRKTLTT